MHNRPSLLFLLAMPVLIWPSCQPDPVTSAEPTGRDETIPPVSESNLIYLDTGQVRLAGIRWGIPGDADLPEGRQLFGEWTLHPQFVSVVIPAAPGRVEEIRYRLNQEVDAGYELIRMDCPDLIDLERQYLEVRARSGFTRQEMERQSALAEGGAVAMKGFQEISAEMKAQSATLAALAAELRRFEIDPESLKPESISGKYVIRSPRKGVIGMSRISVGQWVEPGPGLCEIRDLDHLHADVYVYPDQLGTLRPGQDLSVTTAGTGSDPVRVRVQSVDRGLDPEKQAIRVHATLTGPTGPGLVVGGSLTARILRSSVEGEIRLPTGAVLEDLGKAFVLVAEELPSDTRRVGFRKVSVDILARDAQRTLIRSSVLKADDRIVVEGAYYVDAQGRVSEFGEEE